MMSIDAVEIFCLFDDQLIQYDAARSLELVFALGHFLQMSLSISFCKLQLAALLSRMAL